MKPQASKTHSGVVAVVGLLLLAVGVLAFWQRVYIADWVRATQYTPSSEIASVAEQVKFSDRGRFYFYASEPVLDGTQKFTEQCGKHERSTNIIGCYVNKRIYLYDVNNAELSGIEEVTAAHEMLHAAYDRLSDSQRRGVDRLLRDEIDKHMTDTAFVERMKVYESLSEVDKIQEYYAVFATEIRGLSPELEQHYSRYFQDRSHVVDMYDRYSSIFKDLLTEAGELADSLDSQAVRINQMLANYNQASTALEVDIEMFNDRAAAGDFASQADFQYQREIMVARSSQLELQYREINRLIDQYNNDKKYYDGLAEHLTELNNSIDSSLAPAPEMN